MYPPPGDSSPGGQWPNQQPGQPAGPGGYPPPGGPAGYPPPPSGPAAPSGYGPPSEHAPSQYGTPSEHAPSQYGTPGEYGAPSEYGAPAGYPPPPEKRRSRLPLILGLVAGAVLLICGLGTVLALVADDSPTDPSGDPPAVAATSGGPTRPAAKGQPTTDPSTESVEGDLDGFRKGDCLTMTADNKVDEAKCSASGAYKVLLRKDGTLADSACDSTDATDILTQDSTGTSRDFVLCVAKVK